LLVAILGFHAAVAVVAPVLARRVGRSVFLICAFPPAAAVLYAAAAAPRLLEQRPLRETLEWVPSLGVSATFRLDAFALLMVCLVSGIGVLVFLYAYAYFSKPRDDLGKFAGSLMGFSGAMLGLVLSDNLLALFVFWELTSITSYLLIGFEDRKADAREAALQALLTTGSGGLALLGGVVLVGQAAGTYELSALAASPPDASPAVVVGLLLMLLGACTKSAQVPFHTWLPGAMAAPTPVSAYLHSATMVKAGVYLVARLAPVFAAFGPWRPIVVTVGITTMLLGGYRALRQHDLKLVLAYGTISQLGFLVTLFGVGTPDATYAGVAMILAHGIFKAGLFMVVGVIDKASGTRDLRRLGDAWRAMPVVVVAGAVAAASMAGLPPLLGFISKEAALEALLHGGLGVLGPIALTGVVLGSILTFAYSARFVAGTFGLLTEPTEEPVTADAVARPTAVFTSPAVVLAGLSVLLGLLPVLVDGLVNEAAIALDPAWKGYTLELWHGLTVALGLSAVIIAVGALLYVARAQVAAAQLRMPSVGDSREAYLATVRGLLVLAKRVTAVVQNGSLPTYQMIILGVLVVVPGTALLGKGVPDLGLPFATDAGQVAVATVMLVAAAGAVLSGRRFPAVLFLGAVGYGVAILFVLQGAPDLALTQLLIETLSLVIFALVLRSLPDRFTRRPVRASRVLRGVVAGGVGLLVTVFALFAGANRTAEPVGTEYLARAYTEAEGRNVVNVILVDFRALDTLGEIVVLLVAALGIVALVQASRAERAGRPATADGTGDGVTPDLDSSGRGAVRQAPAEPALGSPRPQRRGDG
jgi:multicomponent Na+:H+ antiporter subunit A